MRIHGIGIEDRDCGLSGRGKRVYTPEETS